MTADKVRSRHVFFLSGFDPKGASWYHRLYAEHARRQGAVTGTHYQVGPRVRLPGGDSRWRVEALAGAERVETCFDFLRWDDIVRAHWPRSSWQVLAGSLRGYAAALASPAALRKVRSASPRTLVALAFPALFWLLAVILAALCGWAAGTLLGAVAADAPAVLRWILAAAAAAAVGWGAFRWERSLNTSWLLRIYQFAADWRSGRVPEVRERTERAADRVLGALREGAADEVLLVGFSVGSLLAVTTAARLQERATAEGVSLERLSLMTLGHCVPLLGLMPGADAFRGDLAALGRAPRVEWTDFSSPTDWGSFALVDPLALSLGATDPQRPHAPRMASPRFHTMFPPQAYARLVRDKRRIHLQYLMAGERPSLYDYFAITAGPLRLRDRMATPPAP